MQMQPCGKDRGNRATCTGQSAVGSKAATASVGLLVCQLLQQGRRRSTIDFVWGVTVKSGMRHLVIVGLNVKVDEKVRIPADSGKRSGTLGHQG